jgi:hypothetical protein
MQPTGSKSRMLVKPLHGAFGGSFADIRGCFQAPPRGGGGMRPKLLRLFSQNPARAFSYTSLK